MENVVAGSLDRSCAQRRGKECSFSTNSNRRLPKHRLRPRSIRFCQFTTSTRNQKKVPVFTHPSDYPILNRLIHLPSVLFCRVICKLCRFGHVMPRRIHDHRSGNGRDPCYELHNSSRPHNLWRNSRRC